MMEWYQSDDRVQEKQKLLKKNQLNLATLITALLEEKREFKKGESVVFLAFCVNKLNSSK